MTNAFFYFGSMLLATEAVFEETFPAIAEAAFTVWLAVSGAVCCTEVQIWAISAFQGCLFAQREFTRVFQRENGGQGGFAESAQGPYR